MLCSHLQRVDYSQHLVKVAARGHRIDEDQLDLLVRPDDKHVPYSLVIGRGASLGSSLGAGWEHTLALRDREVRVADHRVVWRMTLRLTNIICPFRVVICRINTQS